MRQSWTILMSVASLAMTAAPQAWAQAPSRDAALPTVVASSLMEACLPAARGANLTPERAARLSMAPLQGRPAQVGARFLDATRWFASRTQPGQVFIGVDGSAGTCHVVVAGGADGRGVRAKIAATMAMVGFRPDIAKVNSLSDSGRLYSGVMPDGQAVLVGVEGFRDGASARSGYQGSVNITVVAKPRPEQGLAAMAGSAPVPAPAVAPLAARPVAMRDPDLAQAAYRTVADLCLPLVRSGMAAAPLDGQAEALRAPPAELAAHYSHFPNWFASKARPDNLFLATGDQPGACHLVIANTAEGPEIQDKTARTLMAAAFLPISNWPAQASGVNDRLFARRGPDGYLMVRISGAASTVRGGAGDQALIDVRLAAPAAFEALTSRDAQVARADPAAPLWTPTHY